MDLWATLGVSQSAGVGVLVTALAVVGVFVSVLVRRSREPQHVQADSHDGRPGNSGRQPVSNAQEVPMDLWATLGVSRGMGAFALVVGVVAAAVIVGRLVRRARGTERVWVDLSGRR